MPILIALVFLTLAGPALAQPYVDVVHFAYEADALPEDSSPAWTRFTTYTTAEILPPGILRVDVQGFSGNPAPNDFWRFPSPLPADERILFLESRLRVVESVGADTALKWHYMRERSGLSPALTGMNFGGAPGASYFHPVDATEFHVYRIEWYRYANVAKFYVDGDWVQTSIGLSQWPFISDRIEIGRFGPDVDQILEFDWIRLGVMEEAVPTTSSSWGSVKALYR